MRNRSAAQSPPPPEKILVRRLMVARLCIILIKMLRVVSILSLAVARNQTNLSNLIID